MKSLLINRFGTALICAIVLIGISLPSAGQIPPKPDVPYAVNDFASVFSYSQRQDLEYRLVSFSEKTSNRIVVVTVNDLGGYDPSEFAYDLGEKWGVGSEKFDNGIVILIKPKSERSGGQVFIAVGYGLEGVVPDAAAKRIIETKMIPHFKENDYYSAVDEALNVLLPMVSGEITYDEWAGSSKGDTGIGLGAIIAIIIFVIYIISSRKKGGKGGNGGGGDGIDPLAAFILGSALGRHSGGGFGGGGSFGGGGFGGGFRGGFGGGGFGGGGAGGSW